MIGGKLNIKGGGVVSGLIQRASFPSEILEFRGHTWLSLLPSVVPTSSLFLSVPKLYVLAARCLLPLLVGWQDFDGLNGAARAELRLRLSASDLPLGYNPVDFWEAKDMRIQDDG